MDKFWSLKSRLTIPMAHVRGATADPSIASEHKGWRGRVPERSVGAAVDLGFVLA